MAGHSKWATTKHKKAKLDGARGKVFTKLSKEIMVAAKMGGDNPDGNFRLRIAIEKAKDNNMPVDNIKRAIQKGSGGTEGENYEEIVYEGYGPSGTALIMELMTNNRNRTAGEIRHILDKNEGNLGETGCVSWMFDRLGYIEIDKDKVTMDEEEFILYLMEKEIDDIKVKDDIYEIYVEVENLENLRMEIINDGMEMRLVFPDGQIINYEVPVIKCWEYDDKRIIEEKMYTFKNPNSLFIYSSSSPDI